jgi:hypothetical protein
MDGWSKLQSSLGSMKFAQAGNEFSKGFNSSIRTTRERLGQIAADGSTELPQSTVTSYPAVNFEPPLVLRRSRAFDRLKNASPVKQENARLEVENAEDDLVQVAITLMKTVLENVCRVFSGCFAVADPLLLA